MSIEGNLFKNSLTIIRDKAVYLFYEGMILNIKKSCDIKFTNIIVETIF